MPVGKVHDKKRRNLKTNNTPANICMYLVNNGNTGTMYEICSMLITQTPEQQRHGGRSGVFILEQILQSALVFP